MYYDFDEADEQELVEDSWQLEALEDDFIIQDDQIVAANYGSGYYVESIEDIMLESSAGDTFDDELDGWVNAWGMYNDELFDTAEDYAIELIYLQADCMDLFRLEESEGKCRKCYMNKRINALYTGIENISNRLEDEGDMPLTLEGLLKDY